METTAQAQAHEITNRSKAYGITLTKKQDKTLEYSIPPYISGSKLKQWKNHYKTSIEAMELTAKVGERLTLPALRALVYIDAGGNKMISHAKTVAEAKALAIDITGEGAAMNANGFPQGYGYKYVSLQVIEDFYNRAAQDEETQNEDRIKWQEEVALGLLGLLAQVEEYEDLPQLNAEHIGFIAADYNNSGIVPEDTYKLFAQGLCVDSAIAVLFDPITLYLDACVRRRKYAQSRTS